MSVVRSALWSLVLTLTGCLDGTGMTVALTFDPPAGATYVDSWFRARATLTPSDAADAVTCTWFVDGMTMEVSEGAPSPGGTTWDCVADALLLGVGIGDAVQAELSFSRRGNAIGRETTEVRFARAPPLLAVTEMDNGTLAFVDSDSDEILQRTELFDDDTLVDSVSGASVTWGYPMKVGYTPSRDRLLASSSRSGMLWEIEPGSGRILDRHQVSDTIYWYVFSADGDTLYVTDDENEGVAVLDAETWEIEDFVATGQMPITVEIDANGVLYVPNQLANTVSVIDTADGSVREVSTSANPYHAVPEPGLRHLWVAEEVPGVVEVWTLPDLEPAASFKAGTHSVAIAFSPDGHLFFVSDFLDSCVYYGRTDTFQVVGAIPTGSGSLGLTWRDDGRMLYVANLQEGTVSVVDSVTLRKLEDIWGFLGPRLVVQVRP